MNHLLHQDDDGPDVYENIVGDAIHDAKQMILNDIWDLIHSCASDAVDDQSIPHGWDDWYDDNRADMIQSTAEDIFNELKKYYE